MASVKIQRINSALQESLANIIKNKIQDKRLEGAIVSVVKVDTSADLSFAKVYLSIFTKKSVEDAFNAILNSIPYIRKQAANMVQIRNMPILHFKIDDSMEYAAKIDKIIHDINK